MPAPETQVNDRDPQIIYSLNWQQRDSARATLGTVTGTQTKGSTAQFHFIGTNVIVFGTFPEDVTPGQPPVTFTLDNTSAAPAKTLGTNPVKFPFYESGPIASAEHTLIITYTETPGQQTSFWLDYIIYVPPVSTSSSSTSTSISSKPQSIGTSAQPTVGVVVSQTTTSTSSSSITSSTRDFISGSTGASLLVSQSSTVTSSKSTPVAYSSSLSIQNTGLLPSTSTSLPSSASTSEVPSHGTRINMGAIAGGVSAGVVIIMSALIFYYWICRRQRWKVDVDAAGVAGLWRRNTTETERHLFPQSFSSIPLVSQPNSIPLDILSQRHSSRDLQESSALRPMVSQPSDIPLDVIQSQRHSSSSAFISLRANNSRSHILRHEDSGLRLEGGPAIVDSNSGVLNDIPPMYTPE